MAIVPAVFYGAGYSQCHDIALNATHTGGPYMLAGGDVYGMWRSQDLGKTWQTSAAGLTTTGYRNVQAIKWTLTHDGYVYALVGSGNFHWAWSSDYGNTWTPMESVTIPQTWTATDQPRAMGRLICIAEGADARHDSIYFGSSNGIYASYGNGAFQQVGANPIALGSGDTCTLASSITLGTNTATSVNGMPTYWASGMSVKINTETIQVTVNQAAHTIAPSTGNWAANHVNGSTVTGQGFRLFDLVIDPNNSQVCYCTFTPIGLAAGGAVYRVSGIQSGGATTVTKIASNNQPMGALCVTEGGNTVLYVASLDGIQRITTPAGTPTVTTITTGLSDSGGTGKAFDNVATNWNGVCGYNDGTHTHLWVGAGTPATTISSGFFQTAWRIDNADASPTIWLIAASTAHRKSTYFDGTGDTWWFSITGGSNLFGGGSYVITEMNLDPNNQGHVYFSGRAGLWHCGNPSATNPDVYPMVNGISATVAQDCRIDPANQQIQVVGDTDWTLFVTTDEWQTSGNLTNYSSWRPAGANNGTAYATRFDTFGNPNPSPLLIGGGNRDNNTNGWISSIATPISSGAETHENAIGSNWPAAGAGTSSWGVAAALRCMVIAQGQDQTGTRVVLAVADSTGSPGNSGIYRKPGAVGSTSPGWTQVQATFATSNNKAPSLYWVDATHIYAYDAVNKIIYRSSEVEQVNNYGQTWAPIIGTGSSVSFPPDSTNAVNQSFLAPDPTKTSRIYFTTLSDVYRIDNADGSPTTTNISNGTIAMPGVSWVDYNGFLYVIQLPVGQALAFWRCTNPTGASPTWVDISTSAMRESQLNPNNMVISPDGTFLMSNGGLGGWAGKLDPLVALINAYVTVLARNGALTLKSRSGKLTLASRQGATTLKSRAGKTTLTSRAGAITLRTR